MIRRIRRITITHEKKLTRQAKKPRTQLPIPVTVRIITHKMILAAVRNTSLSRGRSDGRRFPDCAHSASIGTHSPSTKRCRDPSAFSRIGQPPN